MYLRSARSGSRALRCRSILPVGGFASSASRMGYPRSFGVQRCPARAASAEVLRRVFEAVLAKCIAAGVADRSAGSLGCQTRTASWRRECNCKPNFSRPVHRKLGKSPAFIDTCSNSLTSAAFEKLLFNISSLYLSCRRPHKSTHGSWASCLSRS